MKHYAKKQQRSAPSRQKKRLGSGQQKTGSTSLATTDRVHKSQKEVRSREKRKRKKKDEKNKHWKKLWQFGDLITKCNNLGTFGCNGNKQREEMFNRQNNVICSCIQFT